MALTTYRYVLLKTSPTNVRIANAVGELTGVTGRSLQRTLNGIDTASLTMSLTDPVARHVLLQNDPDAEFRLKIYRDEAGAEPRLVFYGPVVDVETLFGPSSGSIQINAASPIWYLTHRYAFKETSPAGFPAQKLYTGAARAQVAMDALSDVLSEGFVGMGIDPTVPAGSGSIGVGEPYDAAWRNMAELLTEMSGGTGGDGFDFYCDPLDWPYLTDPSSASYGAMGALRLVSRRGEDRGSVIFETGIGTRNNAVEARQSIARGSMANVVYHVADVYSAADIDNPEIEKVPVVLKAQEPSITARARHEAILRDDVKDSGETSYRQQLVDLHAAVRQRPRRTITFQPAPEEQGPSVPQAFADYDIGDSIYLRVVAPNGIVALNEKLRVYGIDTEVDDGSGTGQHTLTLTPEN